MPLSENGLYILFLPLDSRKYKKKEYLDRENQNMYQFLGVTEVKIYIKTVSHLKITLTLYFPDQGIPFFKCSAF